MAKQANMKKKKHIDKRTLLVRIVAIVLAVMIVGSIVSFALMNY